MGRFDGFVGGFQQGYGFSQDATRKRKIDKAIDLRNTADYADIKARDTVASDEFYDDPENEGLEYESLLDEYDSDDYDPFLRKIGDFFRGVGGTVKNKAVDFFTPENYAEIKDYSSGGPVKKYADGGRNTPRGKGGRALESGEPISLDDVMHSLGTVHYTPPKWASKSETAIPNTPPKSTTPSPSQGIPLNDLPQEALNQYNEDYNSEQPKPQMSPIPQLGQETNPNTARKTNTPAPTRRRAVEPVARRRGKPTANQMAEQANYPITPQEMPNVTTRDWEKTRRARRKAAALRGESVQKADQEVTMEQIDGFMRNGLEAIQLLAAERPDKAAVAMYAAYQYFPNGADVEFATTRDANGQPAIVGMGKDEETGKRVGQPMILNAERLNAMLTNMQDPKNFLQWTKDWREELRKDREYNEITVPKAEADMANERADVQTRRLGARTREQAVEDRYALGVAGLQGRGGGENPVTPAELRMRSERIDELLREDLFEYIDTNAADIRTLSQVGATASVYRPDILPEQLIPALADTYIQMTGQGSTIEDVINEIHRKLGMPPPRQAVQ